MTINLPNKCYRAHLLMPASCLGKMFTVHDKIIKYLFIHNYQLIHFIPYTALVTLPPNLKYIYFGWEIVLFW